MAKKKQKLTSKEIFTMLFDIAVEGKTCNWSDDAVESVLGPPDYDFALSGRTTKSWYDAKERAREKLFELFIKE